jgi:hypothetical protein
LPASRRFEGDVSALGAKLLPLLIVACAACSGASLRNGVYTGDQATYRVGPVPDGYDRVEISGNDLAFHRRGEGTISVNSTCTDYEDVPLTALVNHLLFETTARQFLVEETVTLDGRAARHALVHAELDGVPIELELYVMKKNGCVFDLAHVRPRGAPDVARRSFRAFVERFALLEVRRDV